MYSHPKQARVCTLITNENGARIRTVSIERERVQWNSVTAVFWLRTKLIYREEFSFTMKATALFGHKIPVICWETEGQCTSFINVNKRVLRKGVLRKGVVLNVCVRCPWGLLRSFDCRPSAYVLRGAFVCIRTAIWVLVGFYGIFLFPAHSGNLDPIMDRYAIN